jgi:hypothetical protein
MGRLWGWYGYSVTMNRPSVRAIRASAASRSSCAANAIRMRRVSRSASSASRASCRRRIAGTRRAAVRSRFNRPTLQDGRQERRRIYRATCTGDLGQIQSLWPCKLRTECACVQQIESRWLRNFEMSLLAGSGSGRARSPSVAQRPTGARIRKFATAPVVSLSGRQRFRFGERLNRL